MKIAYNSTLGTILEPVRFELATNSVYVTPMTNIAWKKSKPNDGIKVNNPDLKKVLPLEAFKIHLKGNLATIQIQFNQKMNSPDLAGIININGRCYSFGAELREKTSFLKNNMIIDTVWHRCASKFCWK